MHIKHLAPRIQGAGSTLIHTVDVSGNVLFGIGAGEEGGSPDQFGFQRLEERLAIFAERPRSS